MPLTLSLAAAEQATHHHIKDALTRAEHWRSGEVVIPDYRLDDEVYADALAAAKASGDRKTVRTVEAIWASAKGDFKAIPSFDAGLEIMTNYLRTTIGDEGWLYRQDASGFHQPWLVTNVAISRANGPHDKDSLVINLAATGIVDDSSSSRARRTGGTVANSIDLYPSDVTKKTPAAILLGEGYVVGTPDLRAEYDLVAERFREVATTGFAQQYRFTGVGERAERGWDSEFNGDRANRKVVMDNEPGDFVVNAEAPSHLFRDEDDTPRLMEVPVKPRVRVFDLHAQDFMWVSTNDLTDYVYDQSLREKLVLPESQRELLDILTEDISTFTSDIVEGKSAGNVILCKGVPGVGKTLSAEIYAELVERPLYSIHSGSLGVTADSVRKNLETVFNRAQRWEAVLLLDEADVFVIERGDNLDQNAIVAEFLRTMEYFTGLMFMTTNRADSIDEAIISRCAAIIHYDIPGPEDMTRIWNVLARNYGTAMDPALVTTLVKDLAHIAPRDVKMLLRLALRVSAHKDEPLSEDLFRRCAMFRGITWRA